MIVEYVCGNLNNMDCGDKNIDYVDIEWHEAFKKIHKKVTKNGNEIGIRLDNDILKKGLNQDDVLFMGDDTIIAVNIREAEAITIQVDEHHMNMIPKVCYEIGNRHATLFYGDNANEFITPYNEPMYEMLSRLHGVQVRREIRKFNFKKSISSSINNHTH